QNTVQRPPAQTRFTWRSLHPFSDWYIRSEKRGLIEPKCRQYGFGRPVCYASSIGSISLHRGALELSLKLFDGPVQFVRQGRRREVAGLIILRGFVSNGGSLAELRVFEGTDSRWPWTHVARDLTGFLVVNCRLFLELLRLV